MQKLMENTDNHPPEQPPSPNDDEVKFRDWRLVGVIFIVVTVIAVVSAVIDLLVIGPLEGRI